MTLETAEIFLGKMGEIVFVEKRPFCFKDFLAFEYNGKGHSFKHGTIRNIFSRLKNEGKIERVYQSLLAFYTLKGVKLGKPITLNRKEDYVTHTQKTFFEWLKTLPTQNPAIHDVRLQFSLKGIWKIVSNIQNKLIEKKDEKYNKDITIVPLYQDNIKILTTIHHTDTISIILGCTNQPISIDEDGRMRLTCGLARIQERLQVLVDGGRFIPSPMDWTVDMWHFATDSLYGYNGKRFEMKWEYALGVFRIYSKKKEIRFEIQEYPRATLGEALKNQPSLSLEKLKVLKLKYLE